ncbi:hypothetical protein GSI_02212 [Ganoderma sinense ZZ0214-1]|uniref:Uncharacterized protein n=1 Tax=Ganoderma sinense ZZ0214-1 TaxID=1077348 RepID=A0A2G8SNY7_9APHY|nr:hypothetical protein GSI_02212 [Ganoderma sinense ZZ0214-1]
MATPSSSATTPSPRPHYLQSSATASTSLAMPNGLLPNDTEDRESLARKITADAHLGELALSLRARLLYANFKVKSNTASHTLHQLDSQLSAAGRHTPNGKRTANYFNEPGSPSGNPAGQSSRSGARKGSMAPPPPVTASAAQSLFSSLLAPPPAKRARTIHNPEDPPVPPPEKAVEHAHSPLRPTKTTRTPDAHGKSKSKRAAKEKASAPGSGKSKGKGKQRVTAEGSFETANSVEEREIDMEAAATLTTLLLNQQRPSISATAGSPRSIRAELCEDRTGRRHPCALVPTIASCESYAFYSYPTPFPCVVPSLPGHVPGVSASIKFDTGQQLATRGRWHPEDNTP